jgi:hypothetical protein
MKNDKISQNIECHHDKRKGTIIGNLNGNGWMEGITD